MATTAGARSGDTGWFTSSRSNNGNQCVEVRFDGEAVLIRDSKYRRDPAADPAAEPVITVPATLWSDFLGALRAGRPHPGLGTEPTADGGMFLRHGAITLRYTAAEWQAFLAGVHDREFDHALAAPGR